MASGHLVELPAVEVAYVCDLDAERRARFARRYPSAQATDRYEDLLEDDTLDAVVIATPVFTHHALAKKQMHAFGGMISAELEGTLDDARRFLERCQLFALAESLGGVESLIEHPALMTHGSVPAEVRAALGISDTLVRLSVGIEDPDDLIADLDAALG